jgi:hypothetical protein
MTLQYINIISVKECTSANLTVDSGRPNNETCTTENMPLHYRVIRSNARIALYSLRNDEN